MSFLTRTKTGFGPSEGGAIEQSKTMPLPPSAGNRTVAKEEERSLLLIKMGKIDGGFAVALSNGGRRRSRQPQRSESRQQNFTASRCI